MQTYEGTNQKPKTDFLINILQDCLARKLKWWLHSRSCSSGDTDEIVVNRRIKKLLILCSNVDF